MHHAPAVVLPLEMGAAGAAGSLGLAMGAIGAGLEIGATGAGTGVGAGTGAAIGAGTGAAGSAGCSGSSVRRAALQVRPSVAAARAPAGQRIG